MVLALLAVVLLEPDVPGDGGDGGHRPELVDDVAGQEVDVIVVEVDARIADPVPTQLIQLRVLDPLHTLTDRRLVQVQLRPFFLLFCFFFEWRSVAARTA